MRLESSTRSTLESNDGFDGKETAVSNNPQVITE